jgi:hypothetical protein
VTEEQNAPRPVGAHLRTAVWLVLVGGAVLFGALLATCVGHVLSPEEEEEPDTVTVVRPTPNVVVAMRDLARLESAEYHMERVVDLRDRQTRLFGMVESEDAILLVAAGDVIAGVDFTGMRDGDVVVEPELSRATITLPPPEILVTRLDNERTYVHTRATDTLARRSETLETRARREAESTLEQAAIEADILDRARRNTETTVTTLVRALGYAQVEIRWADAE